MPVCAAVCYFKSAGAAVCEKPRRMPALITALNNDNCSVTIRSIFNAALCSYHTLYTRCVPTYLYPLTISLSKYRYFSRYTSPASMSWNNIQKFNQSVIFRSTQLFKWNLQGPSCCGHPSASVDKAISHGSIKRISEVMHW